MTLVLATRGAQPSLSFSLHDLWASTLVQSSTKNSHFDLSSLFQALWFILVRVWIQLLSNDARCKDIYLGSGASIVPYLYHRFLIYYDSYPRYIFHNRFYYRFITISSYYRFTYYRFTYIGLHTIGLHTIDLHTIGLHTIGLRTIGLHTIRLHNIGSYYRFTIGLHLYKFFVYFTSPVYTLASSKHPRVTNPF